MAEVAAIVAPMTLAYAGAAVGTLVARLALGWLRRGARRPTTAEALWCAALPALGVILLPVTAQVQPDSLPLLAQAHGVWHDWEAQLHRSLPVHAVLHMANGLVGVMGFICLGRSLFELARILGFERVLTASARREADYLLLPTSHPVGCTVGLLHPRIVISAGLRQRLTPQELRVVLAHEAAHGRRRDPLVLALLRLFQTLLPVPGAAVLVQEWRAAAERACDREAARNVASPGRVAATLLRVAQLPAVPHPHPAFCPQQSDLPDRITALLQPDTGRAARRPFALPALSLLAMVWQLLWLPHLVELFAGH